MELKAYITPLRKWWWLILASTLIAAASSYFAVSRQAPIYQARATLIIGSAISDPNPSGTDFWLTQQLASTYTDIAKREVVRNAVMERLGLSWLPSYTAGVVADTQLIEITVTDTSPERAMVVANELADQLVLQTPTSGQDGDDRSRQSFISQQLDELEQKIDETNELVLTRQDELANMVSARQIADVQSQIAALENKLVTLQSNYASMLASTVEGAANSLRVIEPATIPQAPIGPAQLMTVLTSAAIGFSLAVAAAYLLEYLDDTVKVPEDVEAAAGLPTLSGIAKYKVSSGQSYELITLTQPRSPISEAYRVLRTAVLFTNIDKTIRTVMVTSPGPGEGKSTTAANLAVVMAQAGHKVLIIDADLRRPTQHRIFEVSRNHGLTNLLVEMTSQLESSQKFELLTNLNKTVLETKQPNLFVLTSGSVPPNPAEVVGSAKMKMLLETLATRFDYLIIDSPPILIVTDAAILSTRADSVLLLANAGETRRNQLKQATLRLREVNANIAGVILNRLTPRSSDYYYYYYYQKNYYHDDTDGDADAEKPTHAKKERRVDQGSKRPLPRFLARILGFW